MALPQRLCAPVLTNAVFYQSTFASNEFEARMAAIRRKIEHIRVSWSDDESYRKLMSQLRNVINLDDLAPKDRIIIEDKLSHILNKFHDYADTTHRISMTESEQYHALELYCSDSGYEHVYSTISRALRQPDATDDLLTAAVALVELVTIDLYNLRLSNFGDDRYSNFQGIVYRCFELSHEDVNRYRDIMQLSAVEQRHFSIPLGLSSSSIDEEKASQFLRKLKSGQHAMTWKIHVHGMDPDLLHAYIDRYPTSVVTSICAMPVARLSPFGEKEILLRGSFFQAIKMDSEERDGRSFHRMELVTISANRDHTTELASHQGEKIIQRKLFRLMAEASRYEVSASVAEKCGLQTDSANYANLQRRAIDELQDMFGFSLQRNQDLAAARSRPKQTWLGGSEVLSYPSHYATLRLEWQNAISEGQWAKALEVLQKDYDWCQNDWFNVAKLSAYGNKPPKGGFTCLHEFATQTKSVTSAADQAARDELEKMIAASEVWKTVRSFDNEAITAFEVSQQQQVDPRIARILQPKIIHSVPSETLTSLEEQLHSLINEEAGPSIRKHNFHLPQLSVLTEMQLPELWIPIPHMYGGFVIELRGNSLRVVCFKTEPGRSQPITTERFIEPREPTMTRDETASAGSAASSIAASSHVKARSYQGSRANYDQQSDYQAGNWKLPR